MNRPDAPGRGKPAISGQHNPNKHFTSCSCKAQLPLTCQRCMHVLKGRHCSCRCPSGFVRNGCAALKMEIKLQLKPEILDGLCLSSLTTFEHILRHAWTASGVHFVFGPRNYLCFAVRGCAALLPNYYLITSRKQERVDSIDMQVSSARA